MRLLLSGVAFYTPCGRQPFPQVVPWRLGHASIDPSSALGATLTLPGQQPFRQVVPWRLGDAGTNPSSSLSPKRRGHAPLIARPRLHHQPSWTTHLTRPARHECVRPCSDTLSLPSMPPTSWRPFRQWVEPCVSSLFLSLDRQPVPPRATTALGLPPVPRLARQIDR